MKTSHSPLNLLKRPFKQRPQIKQSSTVRPLSALCLYTFTEGARRGASRLAMHPIPIGQTEIHDIKLRQPFPADAANHVFEVTLIALAPRGFSL